MQITRRLILILSLHQPLTTLNNIQLFDSAVFSDIIIWLGIGSSARVNAHMAILSMGSEWFHRSSIIYGRGGIELKLPHEDHVEMKRLLRHIYGFKVFPAPHPSTIHMDIKLLKLASKYEVPTLIDQAEESIAGRLRGMKDDRAETAATCAVVLNGIYELPKGDGELRQLAAEACHRHMADLIADDVFQKTLLKFPEMGADLMKRPTVKAKMQESKKRRRF